MGTGGTWFESLLPEDDPDLPEIDVSIAHPARMYDYYLGGKTHFSADREAAEKVLAVLPEGRAMAVANRAFLGRAVRFLASRGINQFLDIGTGIPSPGNTGEVVREINQDAHVVYVDNDRCKLGCVHAKVRLQVSGLPGIQEKTPAKLAATFRAAARITSTVNTCATNESPASLVAKPVV